MPKTDAAANASASPNRQLVLVGDGHDKFWSGELDGSSYTTRWGRNGTAGQSKTFTAKSADAAKEELAKKTASKLKEGYVDAPSGDAAKPAGKSAFFSPGLDLGYKMADFDANDPYVFTITKAGTTLGFHWQLGGCPDNGDVEISAKALEGAEKFLSFSQGSVGLSDGSSVTEKSVVEDHLPPFLLSRSAFKALKSKKPTSLRAEWGDGDKLIEVTLVKAEKLSIKFDGKARKLDVLHASGDDLELWVLDEPEWPLVVKREECGGDNFWVLEHAGSKPGEVARLLAGDDGDDD